MTTENSTFIVWLDHVDCLDRSRVGGKAANLGALRSHGVHCPRGFCITEDAFRSHLETARLPSEIEAILKDKSRRSTECAREIGRLLRDSEMPEILRAPIVAAYQQLRAHRHGVLPVAVRSSAVLEDTLACSFAGQFESHLGVKDEDGICLAIRQCWASLFGARSIAYARRRQVDLMPPRMAVIVQALVLARAAGVMFTAHPVTHERDRLLVEAVYGLAERLLSGQASPDTYVVLKKGGTIVEEHIALKTLALEPDCESGGLRERNVALPRQMAPVLNSAELATLAQLGTHIEAAFGEPQDIEWAMEGDDIFVVQARPITGLTAVAVPGSGREI